MLTLAAVLPIILFGLSQLKVELDMYQSLGPSFESQQAQQILDREFGDSSSVFVALDTPNPLTMHHACQIKTWLERELQSDPGILKILTPWMARVPQSTPTHLWYQPVLKDPCVAPSQESFYADLQKLGNSPWQNLFTGKSQGQVSFEVVFRENLDADASEKFDVNSVGRLIHELELFAQNRIPGTEVHVFGQVSLRWYLLEVLKKDAAWNLGILIFFVGIFYLFIGTWRAGGYYILTLFVTEVFLFGLMGLLGFPIDNMSNCLFLMVAIAGTSDFLFVTSAQRPGDHWLASFTRVATPSFFTSLTTVAGFLSLGVADIPMIERFGMAAALGAILQWASNFIFLPAVLAFVGARQTWVKDLGRQPRAVQQILKLNDYAPGRISTSFLLILGLAGAFSFSNLNIGEDILQNFPSQHPFTQAYQWLKQDKGWQGQMDLVFKPDAPPQQMDQILKQILQHPEVVHIDHLGAFQDYIAKDLSGLRKDLALREMTSVMLKKFKGPEGYLRTSIATETMNVPRLTQLADDLRLICGDWCFPAGRTVLYLESSARISRGLIESLIVSLFSVAVILITLTWLKGSPHYLSLILSSVWAPVFMIGFLALTGWPVSSVTSVFFALIVGWTGDNAIQYLFADDDIIKGTQERASATLIQTLIFCGSSLFLMFQVLIPMKILGMLFVLGFLVTYVGDVWILKGLLNFRRL